MDTIQVELLSGLTEEQKAFCTQQYAARAKSTGTAYLCMILFAVHYFYLGKPLLNLLYWFTLGGLGVWGLYNLFCMKLTVRSTNTAILKQLVEESKRLYPAK